MNPLQREQVVSLKRTTGAIPLPFAPQFDRLLRAASNHSLANPNPWNGLRATKCPSRLYTRRPINLPTSSTSSPPLQPPLIPTSIAIPPSHNRLPLRNTTESAERCLRSPTSTISLSTSVCRPPFLSSMLSLPLFSATNTPLKPHAQRFHFAWTHFHRIAIHNRSHRRLPPRFRHAFLRDPRNFHLLHSLPFISPRFFNLYRPSWEHSADRKAPQSFFLPRGSSGIQNRIENVPKSQKKHRILRIRPRYAHNSDNRGNSIGLVKLRFEFDGTIQWLQTRQNRHRFHRGFHDSTFRGDTNRTL